MIDTIVNSFDIWTDAQGIKSRTRLKSVDNISLDGLSALRQLILELAVTGRLVIQDPNDEPASELLKKIAKEKERLIKEGKLKKEKPFPEITTKGLSITLPKGWVFAYWNDIAFKIGDIDHKMPEQVEVGYSYISPRDFLPKNMIDLKGAKKISEDDYLDLSAKIKPEIGDIIYPRYGTIGENRLVTTTDKFLASYSCCIIKTMHGFIDPKYQFFYSMSEFVKKQAKKAENKTTQANVGIKSIQAYIVPLPPISEQRRIVAKVDELMALCDTLEKEQFNNLKTHQLLVKTLLETLTQAADAKELQEAWERMSANFDTLFCTEDSIDQLKQTILQLAVMGKLVKQDPNDEPACELIKKIAKEKERLIEEGKLKKTAPLAEISDNEKIFILPKGWEWKRLNDVIDVRDGTHDSPKEAFGDDTYPLITSQNFENGNINFNTAKRISETDHIEISKRSLVERFDILFSMIGGNLGNQVMVNTDRPFSVKNVALFKYYSKEHTSPYFIKKIMEYIAITLQSRAIGGAQPFVSLGFLRNIVIALPPKAEQKRIVEKIDELFSVCEFLQEKLKNSQELKVLLSKTIVEKAVQ